MYSAAIRPCCVFIIDSGGKPGWPRSALHSSSEKINRGGPVLGGEQNAARSVSLSPAFRHLWELMTWVWFYSQLFIHLLVCLFIYLFLVGKGGAIVLGRHTAAGRHLWVQVSELESEPPETVKVCFVPFQLANRILSRHRWFDIILGQRTTLSSRKCEPQFDITPVSLSYIHISSAYMTIGRTTFGLGSYLFYIRKHTTSGTHFFIMLLCRLFKICGLPLPLVKSILFFWIMELE